MPDRLHLELDAVSEFLVDEAGRRLTIDVDQPLKPANQRLMDFLGVEVRMTATAGGVSCLVGGCEWRFDGDYDERLAAIEKHREEEHDYIPAHRFSVRDAMDSLLTQRQHLGVDDQADDVEDEPTYPGQFETSDSLTADEVPKPEEEVATVRGGVVKWPREGIIEAIQAFHAEHGRPPKADEWIKSSPDHPTQSTVNKHFGSWAAAIEAAGGARWSRRRMTTAKCRSCDAEIIWTVTDNGRKMPVDAKPTGKAVVLIPLANDELRARVVDTYRSHFETCPNADSHRRRAA